VKRAAIHRLVTFVLVRPHYPENVGAAARALKTMGFERLGLVSPSRLASPEHEMARKMAVKSADVLEAAQVFDSVREAMAGYDDVYATSSRRGIAGAWPPRKAAPAIRARAEAGKRVTILFGNEKTGLHREELLDADRCLRIPIAADQPSINLAQAVQVIAYELFVAELQARDAARSSTEAGAGEA
jgi:tRNA (cytidine32/uridine32-2'-O)-methyltransferase